MHLETSTADVASTASVISTGAQRKPCTSSPNQLHQQLLRPETAASSLDTGDNARLSCRFDSAQCRLPKTAQQSCATVPEQGWQTPHVWLNCSMTHLEPEAAAACIPQTQSTGQALGAPRSPPIFSTSTLPSTVSRRRLPVMLDGSAR